MMLYTWVWTPTFCGLLMFLEAIQKSQSEYMVYVALNEN